MELTPKFVREKISLGKITAPGAKKVRVNSRKKYPSSHPITTKWGSFSPIVAKKYPRCTLNARTRGKVISNSRKKYLVSPYSNEIGLHTTNLREKIFSIQPIATNSTKMQQSWANYFPRPSRSPSRESFKILSI